MSNIIKNIMFQFSKWIKENSIKIVFLILGEIHKNLKKITIIAIIAPIKKLISESRNFNMISIKLFL